MSIILLNSFAFAPAAAAHDIVWANLTNASVIAANALEASAGGWGGGGSSSEKLNNGVAGYVEITVTGDEGTPVSRYRMFGLGTTNTGGGYARINFAAYLEPTSGGGGDLHYAESGGISGVITSYVTGDVIRVEKDAGGTVTYKKNGSIWQTSGVTASTDLYANGTPANNTGYLENITLSAAFA